MPEAEGSDDIFEFELGLCLLYKSFDFYQYPTISSSVSSLMLPSAIQLLTPNAYESAC